jgi:hypothetical protein
MRKREKEIARFSCKQLVGAKAPLCRGFDLFYFSHSLIQMREKEINPWWTLDLGIEVL